MIDYSEYIDTVGAIVRTGLTPRTLERRCKTGEVYSVRDPRDRRRRLILISSLDRACSIPTDDASKPTPQEN